MKPIHQLQTMACAYQEICQGEEPWVALGNFMNYCLSEPWFDALMVHKPEVREWLIQDTPEPFTRRNIYCGNPISGNWLNNMLLSLLVGVLARQLLDK